MPNVVCPSCKTTLSVTDAMLGGEVQCGQCQTVFRMATGETKRSAARRDDEEESRPSRSRPHRDEEDEDERPSRRSRSRRDEDDEDDRPRRRSRSRRYEEDDDDYGRPRRNGGNGMAVTGMILGIIAISVEVPATMVTSFGSFFCCGLGAVFTWPPHVLGAALGITGTILGAMGMKKKEGKGMAVTGVSTSVAALVLALISVILIAAGYAAWDRAARNAGMFIPPPPPPPVFRGGR